MKIRKDFIWIVVIQVVMWAMWIACVVGIIINAKGEL